MKNEVAVLHAMGNAFDGIVEGKLEGWNGKVYKVPREFLRDWYLFMESNDLLKYELSARALYFLIGEDLETEKAWVYVGITDSNIRSRLDAHDKDPHKQHCHTIVIIFSMDNAFPDLKYLESRCIQLIATSKRNTILANNQQSNRTAPSQIDETRYHNFIVPLRSLMRAMGYEFLEPLKIHDSGSQTGESKEIEISDNSEFMNDDQNIFIYASKNSSDWNAKAIYTQDGGILVLKGSKVRIALEYKYRKDNFDKYDSESILQEDLFYKSIHLAASFISDNSANGWDVWKRDGKTLDEIVRKPIA